MEKTTTQHVSEVSTRPPAGGQPDNAQQQREDDDSDAVVDSDSPAISSSSCGGALALLTKREPARAEQQAVNQRRGSKPSEKPELLRVLLHTPGTWSVKQPEVTYLIARHNLRFKEIDEFVAQLRPRFAAEVERQKKASAEWGGASELDREDMLAEFEERAIQSLGLNHNAFNLELLMTGDLKHVEEDDVLLDRFAGDSALYSIYLGQLGRGGSVVTVASTTTSVRRGKSW